MSLDSKIKLTSPLEEAKTEAEEIAAAQEPEIDVLPENEQPAETAEEAGNEPADEMPILIPDDYDADDIDYSEGTNLSAVVSAKEDIQEAVRYQRPKLRGKEAWDNFWYHHKLKVIVITAMTILLGWAAIISIPTKFDSIFNIFADVNLGLTSQSELIEQMTEYCVDVNENGKVDVNVLINNIYSTADPYSSIAGYMALDTELSGEYSSFLWIVDRPHYDYVVTELGEETFEAYEGYPVLISLKDSELITSISASAGNDKELFLVMVRVPEKYKDDAEVIARHDSAVEVLERILAANPELSAQALQDAE